MSALRKPTPQSRVLDKAGKKASEGGVALRNVLGQLSKGRFIEKQAREELEKAGIDVVALGDNSKSLKERLEMLKPMLNDSALLSKFFGVENANAARALIQGTDALQGFTDAVTGTNSATEQAAIVMDSYAERQAEGEPAVRGSENFHIPGNRRFFALVRRADFRTGTAGPACAVAHSCVETHARNKRS